MSRLSFRPRPLDIHKKLPIVKSVKDFEDEENTTSTRNSQISRLTAEVDNEEVDPNVEHDDLPNAEGMDSSISELANAIPGIDKAASGRSMPRHGEATINAEDDTHHSEVNFGERLELSKLLAGDPFEITRTNEVMRTRRNHFSLTRNTNWCLAVMVFVANVFIRLSVN